ncbi:MAG TPA: hypothetical protein VFC84_08645 [Desulfosporosinus sp.]|nr:hypothetical protein [Desulfosporosinus sp.]
MPFDDNLYGTRTPHRLLALLKLVARGRMTSDLLKHYLQPTQLNPSQTGFEQVFSLARKGDLIKEDAEEIVHLQFDPLDLEDERRVRFVINQKIMAQPERVFVRFSTWYLMQGRAVYRLGDDELVASFIHDLGATFNKTKLNAWKRWFIYFGYGFLHNGDIIPNVAGRLRDVLAFDHELPRQKAILLSDFMTWLNRTCPELDFGEYANNFRGSAVLEPKKLFVGLSSGLRALHDQGLVTLIYTPDATNIWQLHRVSTHEIAAQVSSILIGGSL